MVQPKGYWSCYTINSQKNGVFKGIEMDSEFERNNVVEYELFAKPGDSNTFASYRILIKN